MAVGHGVQLKNNRQGVDHMKRFVLGLLAAAAMTVPAFAADVYNVDKAHSEASFQVRHLGISNVRGHFTDFEGSVNIDRAKPEASSVETRK